MTVVAAIAAVLLIVTVLWDAFETIVLPRRVTRQIRLTRYIFYYTWQPWQLVARRIKSRGRREAWLSIFGPLSLLILVATWAVALIVGFAVLHWALGTALLDPLGRAGFGTDLYESGTTFFTLGLGDVTPRLPSSRALTVVEAGMGFAFLALMIGYLPVLYQAFSGREVDISLLDARAGSPPSGVELLRRYGVAGRSAELEALLVEWERWAAVVMESHLSYPSLAYFRSQHDNQSWLAALTTILDACTLVLAGLDEVDTWPAQLTYAMARHAVVDLSQVLVAPPRPPEPDRLPPEDLAQVRRVLAASGLAPREGSETDRRMAELRGKYEPYVNGLSERLLLPLPPWIPRESGRDDWETTSWDRLHRRHTAPVIWD